MSFTRLSNVFQEIIVRLSTSFRKNCGSLHRSCQPLRRRTKSTCHDVCEAIQQRLPERVELERNLLGGVVRAALRKPLPASLPARLRSGSFSICCITDCRKDAHKITFILSFLFRDKQRGSNMPNINKPGGSSSLWFCCVNANFLLFRPPLPPPPNTMLIGSARNLCKSICLRGVGLAPLNIVFGERGAQNSEMVKECL